MVFTIMNEALDPEESGFLGMVTLINLGDDDFETIHLHLPPKWRAADQFQVLEQSGQWAEVPWERTEDGIEVCRELKHLMPMYLRIG